MRTVGPTLCLIAALAIGCDVGQPSGRAPEPEVPAGPRVEIDNPQYQSWASFPKGTVVVHRSVTQTDGTEGATVTTTTYTLVDLTPEQAVVELQTATRRYDGLETKNQPVRYTHPKRFPLPPGTKSAEPVEQGEETIRVAGIEYRTRWHTAKDRNEAGEVLTRIWSSAGVPGGLVKSLTRTAAIGKTTTTELVEVRTGK
jgi:hypothetical protein